jgi:hypothetical protein
MATAVNDSWRPQLSMTCSAVRPYQLAFGVSRNRLPPWCGPACSVRWPIIPPTYATVTVTTQAAVRWRIGPMWLVHMPSRSWRTTTPRRATSRHSTTTIRSLLRTVPVCWVSRARLPLEPFCICGILALVTHHPRRRHLALRTQTKLHCATISEFW